MDRYQRSRFKFHKELHFLKLEIWRSSPCVHMWKNVPSVCECKFCLEATHRHSLSSDRCRFAIAKRYNLWSRQKFLSRRASPERKTISFDVGNKPQTAPSPPPPPTPPLGDPNVRVKRHRWTVGGNIITRPVIVMGPPGRSRFLRRFRSQFTSSFQKVV